MRLKTLALSIAIVATVIAPAMAETFSSGPIKFRLASDGGTAGDLWIVADGEITDETGAAFRQFLASKNINKGGRIEVYLNSPGGNIFGGVQLGEAIREFGFGTRVARSVPLGSGDQFETDGPGGCYSACSFAFLGGKWRIASDRSLGVHQNYSKEALTEPNAPKFTALDFSAQQLIDGLLLEYVVRMGADQNFLMRASTTVPVDMYAFTSGEMKQFGITWNDLEYTDWSFEAYKDGLIAVSKTRNGENIATLFCRKDRALRLLINSPYTSKYDYLGPFLKGKVKVEASAFGADISSENISGRVERGRLMLELLLPPSLNSSDNNLLPDGKNSAWYLKKIQFDTPYPYDPTSAEWKTLTPQEKQFRRQLFELAYRGSFGVSPSYAVDGNPIIPEDMPNFGGLSASGQFRDYFAHKISGKNFLTYSKLIRRNCI